MVVNIFAGGTAQPTLTLTLGTVDNSTQRPSWVPLCNGSALYVSPLPDAPGYNMLQTKHRALFQNHHFRSYNPDLDQVTSFRIQSTSRVSFCMHDISLLPSTLQPAGKLWRLDLVTHASAVHTAICQLSADTVNGTCIKCLSSLLASHPSTDVVCDLCNMWNPQP